MINQILVEEILMSPLHIEANYAQALAMSAYFAYANKKPLTNSRFESAYSIKADTGVKQTTDSTPGSVGIVVIDGPIVSASDPWYGIKGTLEAAQELLALDADPNIIGTVLYLESGGGAVYALKPIIDVLNSLEKPVVTFSKQIIASAAYRIGANTDYIMMYHPQGIVGSLGTMSSFSDMQPMFEKWGMKFFEYYATESTLKNKTFRDAKAGDGKSLIANILDPMNDLFLSDIKALRGDKINSKDKTIYQGETYLADPTALSLGLIDATGTIQDAVAMVVSIAEGKTPSSINSNFQKSNNHMALFNKFPKVAALKVAAGSAITAEMIKAANEELVAEGVAGVTLVLDSELEQIDSENKGAGKASSENTAALTAINSLLAADNQQTTLTAAVAALKAANGIQATALTTANTALATMTTDRDKWQAKAIKYGAQAAEEPTAGAQVETDKIANTSPDASANFYSEADAEMAEIRKNRVQLPGKK